MFVDYYFVKRGNLNIHDVYVGNPSSRYWYYKSVNPRVVAVTVIALIPCLPSFAAQIAPNHLGLSIPNRNFFYISFVVTYAIAAGLYYLSYPVFPEKNLVVKKKSLLFEFWADENDAEELAAADMMATEAGARTPEEDEKADLDSEKL